VAAPRIDVAVVGGGPVGLATAIACASRGLRAAVFERQRGAPDKACGEGLTPEGLLALDRLGARRHLDPSMCAPMVGIRYVQDGAAVEGRFRQGMGLGIRRPGLVRALQIAARAAGVELQLGTAVRHVSQAPGAVTLEVDGCSVSAAYAVAADGLHSPLRRSFGLEGVSGRPERWGLRRHYRNVAPGRWVEVHWHADAECYLTPTGPNRLGVAFLFGARTAPRFEALLARFPEVARRLRGAAVDSPLRGAGPLRQLPKDVVAGRVALVGDAAGYVDALTGEGLSLGFACARALAEALAKALTHGPDRLDAYRRAHARLFQAHARSAGGLVWLAQRPPLRRAALRVLARAPALFELALRAVG